MHHREFTDGRNRGNCLRGRGAWLETHRQRGPELPAARQRDAKPPRAVAGRLIAGLRVGLQEAALQIEVALDIHRGVVIQEIFGPQGQLPGLRVEPDAQAYKVSVAGLDQVVFLRVA